MLRDEAEVALNDLIRLSERSAEDYDIAAEMASEDAELAALFKELAAQRRAMTAELSSQDRRIGGLPHDTDPDYSTVHDLYVRLKTKLSQEPRLALIEECEESDIRIAERIDSALTLQFPEATREALRRFRYDVTASLGRLAASKARL